MEDIPSPRTFNRWASIRVPDEVHDEISVIARVEGRTIASQVRVILDAWKRQNLSRNDLAFLAAELAAYRTRVKTAKERAEAAERALREIAKENYLPPGRQPKPGHVVGLRSNVEDTEE